MEDLLAGERPIDFVENDFQYILDSGVFQNVPLSDHLDSLHSNQDVVDLWEDPLLSNQFLYDDYGDSLSPRPDIKTDHSYSMADEPDYPFFKTIKVEPEDYESDASIKALPLSPELSQTLSLVKKEIDEDNFSDDYCEMDISGRMQQFVLKEPLKPHLKPKPTQTTVVVGHVTKHELPYLTLELPLSGDECSSDNVDLPPTPPSSTPSDSDGGSSPQRGSPSEPGSPVPYHSPIKKPESRTTAITAHMFTNLQRLPQSGPMVLTDEEKRTLVAEGYPIPTDLPLTKAEEKSLKKVRRKIKNKISAQESRRKKKEYVEALEKRMESYTHENGELRKKVDNLKTTNESLAQQLERLQAIVSKISRPIKASATQTGTCLMVLVLCFAVFLGSWSPHSLFNDNSSNTVLFSKPASPASSSYPEPFPYGPVIHYQYNNDPDERSGPIYGPEEDPYVTPPRQSSRLLMSIDDEECTSSVHNPYMTYKDDVAVPPPVYRPVTLLPDGPYPDGYATVDSMVTSVAGATVQLQASLHPDIQVEVPIDTLASINRSSNK